jgi:hypothetical protein
MLLGDGSPPSDELGLLLVHVALGVTLSEALGSALGGVLGKLLGDELGPELGEAPGTALGAVLGPCFGQRRSCFGRKRPRRKDSKETGALATDSSCTNKEGLTADCESDDWWMVV